MSFYATDKWLGRSLDLYGEWSEGEADLLRAVLKPDDCVVEAGSNLGALTLPMAEIVREGAGKVWAFEPQPEIFDMLLRNLSAYPHSVHPSRRVLGKANDVRMLARVDYSKGTCNPGGFEALEDCETGVPTPATTIDSLNFDRLDLIKADVEGMELDVLAGAQRTILHYRPLLYVEDDREEKRAALRAWILEQGYRIYSHQPLLYNPGNFNGYKVNVFPNIVSAMLFCVPVERGPEFRNVTNQLERLRA